jgi:hypothetical protein
MLCTNTEKLTEGMFQIFQLLYLVKFLREKGKKKRAVVLS